MMDVPASWQLSQTRILVVEDDPEVARHLTDLLQKRLSNASVLCAVNASDAMDNLAASQTDLLPHAAILDIMLPYGDAFDRLGGKTDPDEKETGLRLLRWLRDRPNPLCSLPVYVITARANVGFVSKVRQYVVGAEMGGVFQKPFDYLELIALMSTRLQSSPFESQPRD